MPPAITVILGDLVRVHCQGDMLLLPMADIVMIRSRENYTLIHLADGRQLTVRLSMKTWEAQLPADTFIRTHRTTLINRTRARGYRCVSPKKWTINLLGTEEPVPVGRIYWRKLKSIFEPAPPTPFPPTAKTPEPAL